MQNIDFRRSAAMLAMAVSETTGVKVTLSPVPTAFTDGEHVVIPAVRIKDEHSWRIVEGYTLHEAAHVKYSLFGRCIQNSHLRHLENIFEDARIEAALPRELPGTAKKMEFLNEELSAETLGELAAQKFPSPFDIGDILSYLNAKGMAAVYPGAKNVNEVQKHLKNNLCQAGVPQKMLSELDDLCFEAIVVSADKHTAHELAQKAYDILLRFFPTQPSPGAEGDEQDGNGHNQQSDSGEQSTGQSSGADQGQSSSSPTGQREISTDSNSKDEDQSGPQGSGQSNSKGDSGTDGSEKGDSSNVSGGSGGEQGQEIKGQPGNLSSGSDNGEISPSSQPKPSRQNNMAVNQPNGQSSQQGAGSSQEPSCVPGGGFSLNGPSLEYVLQYTDFQTVSEQVKNWIEAMAEDNLDKPVDLPVVTNLPTVRLNPAVMASYAKGFARLRFAVVANTLKRAQTGYAGHLDCRKLAGVASGTTHRVFRSRAPRKQLDTYIHLLVDTSGSMGDNNRMHIANYTFNGMLQALSNAPGIEMGVSGFTHLDCEAVVMDMNKGGMGFVPTGGTPLAAALHWSFYKVLMHTQRRKICFVITDDELGSEVARSKEIVALYKAHGVQLIGIFIDVAQKPPIFPISFSLRDPSDLPSAICGIWSDLLYPE